ncbi:cell division protein FtsW [Natranaerovirga pectinivora]|uniref:Probable peptidoglycan glycosyltransferase FtsW n=1 Tax=Natranaerovirga pectinivora TaxID=682400 RepID=A0A4R3MNM0_9FIRM|nr:putative lipid II flippase FtsW [Natranaerovirga pectinivora]TCT16857.1 cell division protein FtsW [Natranaerovirga pectinivora]
MSSNVSNLQHYKGSNKTKEKTVKNTLGQIDFTLFIVVIFLVAFGIIMIYSSSAYYSRIRFGDEMHFLKRQLLWAIIGVGAMIFVSNVNYHRLKSYSLILYLASLLFLGLVLIIGEEINGAKRWLSLGPLGGFQPSELTKLCLIIFMAHIISKGAKQLKNYGAFIKYLVFIFPPIVLIAVENLSTAIVVAAIPIGILFVASPKIWHFMTLALPAAAAAGVFLTLFSYRMTRIIIWRNPWADPQGGGFQTIQSLYAIGSGGLFGRGLGQSMQKMGFIPEAHNDIIFSIVCEELGLFGAISLIFVFMVLIWRCMIIAHRASDLFGSLLVVGVMTQIAIQVIINIAVVTNSIPPTGMPLPFISYGGSSLLFLLVEIGIVLNVSKHMKASRIYA